MQEQLIESTSLIINTPVQIVKAVHQAHLHAIRLNSKKHDIQSIRGQADDIPAN